MIHSSLGESSRRQGWNGCQSKREGGHQEKMAYWIKAWAKDSIGLTESEALSLGPTWVYTRSSVYILWLLAWCFGETPMGAGVSLTLLSTLGILSLLLSCLVHPPCDGFCLVLFFFLWGLLFFEVRQRDWIHGEER